MHIIIFMNTYDYKRESLLDTTVLLFKFTMFFSFNIIYHKSKINV